MKDRKLSMGELIFLNNMFSKCNTRKIDDEDLLTMSTSFANVESINTIDYDNMNYI